MHRRLMILTTAAALLTGCATGTTLLTSSSRPPIDPQHVQLFTAPPANYDIIGMVDAKARGRHQTTLDHAVKELNNQAARIGANGILLSGAPQQTKGGVLAGGDWTRVSGQAIVMA